MKSVAFGPSSEELIESMSIKRISLAQRQEDIIAPAVLSNKTIIGIDPGTNVLGYAVIRVEGEVMHVVVLGVIRLGKFRDAYTKLHHIFERLTALIDHYKPDDMALEAPFYAENVQSMLKLGRAQGVAMVAGLTRGLSVTEYAPTKVKSAITGQGRASKEQVSAILHRLLTFDDATVELDSTDALAVAVCHHFNDKRLSQRVRD